MDKVTNKKAKKLKIVPKPKDLTPADYNPRTMSESAGKALKKSMETFDDISGITWNIKTKNIVTGHHRWENLVNKYGLDSLVFKKISDDRVSVFTKEDEDTGFTVRIVNWSKVKEKAANVAANSAELAGTFSINLDNVLQDIKSDFDSTLFSELRFDHLLKSPVESLSSVTSDWTSDIGKIDKVDSGEKEMYHNIQVVVSTKEDKNSIIEKIKEALAGIDVSFR